MFLLLLNCNHTAYTIILVSLIVAFAGCKRVFSFVICIYFSLYFRLIPSLISLSKNFRLFFIAPVEALCLRSSARTCQAFQMSRGQALQELGGGCRYFEFGVTVA